MSPGWTWVRSEEGNVQKQGSQGLPGAGGVAGIVKRRTVPSEGDSWWHVALQSVPSQSASHCTYRVLLGLLSHHGFT